MNAPVIFALERQGPRAFEEETIGFSEEEVIGFSERQLGVFKDIDR